MNNVGIILALVAFNIYRNSLSTMDVKYRHSSAYAMKKI
jgi:hypothetical protein